MAADAVTDLPPGFALDDEKPVKRSPAEDKLAVLAKLSPAEQARSDEFERSPANIRQAKTELAREKAPEARRVIQDEISRQERASTAEPPAGFTVDELPPGFKLDGAAAPAKPLTGAAAVPQDPAAAARVAAEAKARQIVEQREATRRAANPVISRAVGAAEAGLEVATRLLGGSVGGLAGIFGINTEQGGDKGFAEGAQRGIQGVRDALQMVGVTSGKPMSQTGQEYTEAAMEPLEKVGQVLPPTAGVFGTLVGPATAAPLAAQRGAVRAGAGKVADAALEAATPRLSESTMKRAQAATDAGIPISPHQLSDNKFIKLLGETAENVPLAGGGSLRAKRREKFSAALAKQMDPDTDVTVLDDAAFKQLQDAAGERIGEISSKYQMPIEDFGDLNALARRDTPDVQAVVKTFADDLAQIAADNGGVIPGDTLRKLRTEAQSRARNVRGAKPDLANALDDVVHRFDDALTNNAAETDVTALANARRQYAISKTLEPLVAKHPDGSFPPSSLKGVVTSTKEGKRRMARGEGGDLGEYARVGQDLLKEQVSSGTAERNTIYSALGIGAGAGAAFTSLPAAAALYAGSALYNLLGPRVVKRMIDAEKRRNAPKPEGPPPEPTLGQGFEDVPQGARPAGPGPLGDLTPDWETAPGAAPAAAVEALPAEGLTPAVGEAPPTTGPRAALTERAGQQIPAVPGRPDLPDTLVAGGPAEVAATDASNAAMGTPGAIEARRQQGMARVEQAAAAERAEPVPVGEATEIKPEVVKPAPEIPEHPEVAKVKEAILKKRDAEAKKRAAADELRKAAEVEPDPEVKAALIKRAEAMTPKEKADVSTDKSVGAGDLRKEAGQESPPKDGDAKAPKAAGEESLDLGLPNLDEAFLDTQLRAKAKTEPPPTPRGRRQSRRAIEQGIADGTLDAEGGTLALWAMDQNPNLARGLRVEVDAPANAQAKGSYNSASQIVKLFKGQTNPQTAIHEILHHAERLMPEPVQQGIRRSWERAVKKIMSEATPERRQAMEAMDKASGGDADALQTVKKAFADGVLTKEDYQFVNPTEYWAVNGARILHERFTGRGSWRSQARQWMNEMVERVKSFAGMPSESAILKALDEVLNPKSVTGQQKSATMIKSFVGPIPDKIKAR